MTLRLRPKLHQIASNINRRETDDAERSDHSDWCNLVETFSSKDLTAATDRLSAVTALGLEIAKLSGSTYAMGVFACNLVQELAWITGFQIEEDLQYSGFHPSKTDADFGPSDMECIYKEPPRKARLCNVPTWSWGSVTPRILFRPQSTYANELATAHFVDEHKIRVRSRLGRVKICGSSQKHRLDHDCSLRSACTFDLCRPDMPKSIRYDAEQFAVFDTLSDVRSVVDNLIICVEWIELLPRTGALIVARVDEAQDTYRRIGWLEAFEADFFDEEPRTIILV